jgi:hypothetical protein
MKVRQGFVSNSSSSSFVCSGCKHSFSGYDGMYDTEYYCFDCGHEICGDCNSYINTEISKMSNDVEYTIEKLKLDKHYSQELKDCPEDKRQEWIEEYCRYDEYPQGLCPVCNLDIINQDTEFQYLIKKHKVNRNLLREEIKNSFKTLGEIDEM